MSFDALLVSDPPAGGGTSVGTPYVAGYKVNAKVLGQGRGKKIIVYKFKAKKRYQKKQGHRQSFTELEILDIGIPAAAGQAGTTKVKKPKVGGELAQVGKRKTGVAATKNPKANPASKKPSKLSSQKAAQSE